MRRGILYEYHEDGELVLLGAHCPACNREHPFSVNAEYWAREGQGVWEWNGNYDRPTFSPSMLTRSPKGTRVCHSYLEDGKWRYLQDSTHEMAGQQGILAKPPEENA